MNNQKYRFRFDNLLIMSIFHAAAFTALFFYDHVLLLVALSIWMVSHGIGLAVGFHRLLTHRGFKTPLWIEYVITICGCLALQGGHIKWVAIHRKHHRFTDQAEDPHSPRNGFFHSHIGWMINGDGSLAKSDFIREYAPDLCKDRFHYWLNKLWWLPSVTLATGLFFWGGFAAVLWGIFVPVAFGLQFTWMVNSVCHRWGSQMFKTDDDSTNNWWVALLTWGEGWHNNHHDKPTRARHGLKWYQFDPSWLFIRTLQLLGLAREIKL